MIYTYCVFLLINLIITKLNGAPTDKFRIIGGREAIPHSFPYQVAIGIYLKDESSAFCGGSLISPRYVLTAAHCFEKATAFTVILGAHNIDHNEDSQVILFPKKIKTHPNYNHRKFLNDIALIELPNYVRYSRFVYSIPLPPKNKKSYAGEKATVTGWGITSKGNSSSVLEYVTSTILSNEDCKTFKKFSQVITEQHLCLSGLGGVGSCAGDSGGPLVVDGTLVGIVSFSDGNCTPGLPSVFTRVSEYVDWIFENVEDDLLYNLV